MSDSESISTELLDGEVIQLMFVDHRDGDGEWAKCKACGRDVFRPQALLPDSRIMCECGKVAFECVRFAVRYRRLDGAVDTDKAETGEIANAEGHGRAVARTVDPLVGREDA